MRRVQELIEVSKPSKLGELQVSKLGERTAAPNKKSMQALIALWPGGLREALTIIRAMDLFIRGMDLFIRVLMG